MNILICNPIRANMFFGKIAVDKQALKKFPV